VDSLSFVNHVIFGTGAIGRATAAALLRRGERVTMVNRSGIAQMPDSVEVIGGDVGDADFARRVARGAHVVYQTLNPPYHRWAEEFPALQDGVIAAAEASGARFVNMDNLYSYGSSGGRPITESNPMAPNSRKGAVRARMEEQLWAAHAAGRIQVASGRASDYYGPGAGQQSALGDRLFLPAIAGKRVRLLGNPDLVHSYTFLPDIGEALAVLGLHPDALGSTWHLPNDPVPQTSRAMVETVFRLAGKSPRISGTPTIVLRLRGLVDPTVRELVEMQYEFTEPFVVDSSRIVGLGLRATPIDEALETTFASYR